MWGIDISRVDLKSKERDEIEAFLEKFDLSLDKDVEYTICARQNEEIVGTCSFSGRVLKCFAVREDMQGEGLSGKLITELTNVMFDRGIYETFIFTKPKNKDIFKGLGYKVVEEAEDVVLLEGGTSNVKRYVENMFKRSGLDDDEKAALVINCNPFTLGHRYLIEKAAQENDEVVVFVVEEDKSVFPFKVRLDLVKKGVSHLKNVKVIPGGYYIISSATFPSYFLKQKDKRLKAYTELDAKIFGKFIAKAFSIKKRYVGTEPYCPVTGDYNRALVEILPKFGVDVKLVERMNICDKPVSASYVRELIKKGRMEEVKKLVPETTYDFLISNEAKDIIERLRGDFPH